MFNTSSGLSVRRKISTGAAQQGAFLSQAKFNSQVFTVKWFFIRAHSNLTFCQLANRSLSTKIG